MEATSAQEYQRQELLNSVVYLLIANLVLLLLFTL